MLIKNNKTSYSFTYYKFTDLLSKKYIMMLYILENIGEINT